ncbi:MAG: S9 family peptidase [Gemmatimonadetes bacterium]|nr:S9 family peptidase [Gemmatimonadota bacterium]
MNAGNHHLGRTAAAVLAAGLVVLAVTGDPLHAQGVDVPDTGTRRLALEQYLQIEGVSSPRMSPDGRQIVYVRQWIDPVTDTRRSGLWIMNGDGSQNRSLNQGGSPRWSPSGDRLAFLACGTPGGDPGALIDCEGASRQQIYVRIMDGPGAGAITQISRLTEAASNIAWAPDGSRIAFNQFVPKDNTWTIRLPGKPKGAKWTEEPRIVDQLDYRQDRQGLSRSGSRHIFTVPSDGGTPRQITHGDFNHGSPDWSPDGRTIYFDGFRRGDPNRTHYAGGYMGRASKIYSVDVASREIRELNGGHLGVDMSPRISPDGRTIAYLASDSTDHMYVQRRLHMMDADGSNPRLVGGEFDRRILNSQWAPDGSGVYFTADNHGERNLHFASASGGVRKVTDGKHNLNISDINRNGTAVGTLSDPHLPGDVVFLSLNDPNPQRLTHVNDDVLADVTLGELEDFWYESADGWQVQGFIVKPPDFDPNQKYPLVLSIHGGPHSMYTFGFNFSFQNFAANGYVVLYTNPRGSTGYGEEFGNGIDNAWPGKDHDDLMHGVDEMLRRGYVDENNLFVMGCSGGGTLTAWAVTQTTRFAAASARCPITNWISFVGTTDGTSWYQTFRQYPWYGAEEHLSRSPLMFVQNVTTPTLVMVGEFDLRTPVPQSEEFYQALKIEGVPTKMIYMQNEWHGTSRNPSNFLRTELYQLDWFGQYMTTDMKERRIITDDRAGER